MNVYPVNAVEAAVMSCPQKDPSSFLEDLFNRFPSYQADFTLANIVLEGTWNNAVEMDAVIIGNTNAHSGRMELYDNNNLLHGADFNIEGDLAIININKLNINRFVLNLSADENISLGYLFIGTKWELPGFAVQPAKGFGLRNESDRTFSGQATGIPMETLKTFNASFMRIPNETKKTVDNYVSAVQTVIPHVIDPYPEAHEEFEPFYATVNGYGEAVKREENGFYWNFEISWQEAK